MKIIPESGNWFYRDGRKSFQLGVGWYYDPTYAWKLRLSLGFWFVGLMFVPNEHADEIRQQMKS